MFMPWFQVSAKDPDTEQGGQFSFLLDNTPNISRLFSLQRVNAETSRLMLHEPLDREYLSQYTFHVLARDHAEPSLTSSTSVIITVEDGNDEKPYFPQ